MIHCTYLKDTIGLQTCWATTARCVYSLLMLGTSWRESLFLYRTIRVHGAGNRGYTCNRAGKDEYDGCALTYFSSASALQRTSDSSLGRRRFRSALSTSSPLLRGQGATHEARQRVKVVTKTMPYGVARAMMRMKSAVCPALPHALSSSSRRYSAWPLSTV